MHHVRIWNTAVYFFVIALVALLGMTLLAIWGYVPKEWLWRSFASAGAGALFLLALSSALRGLTPHKKHEEVSPPSTISS